ncbi:MAG: PD-(D/E)XK nuclease family protein, partial [Candidatus Heimdallarchaeota archaeon]
ITMAETILVGKSTCYRCPIRCGREVEINKGKYKIGKIDCIELCENKAGLRLIDYKPSSNQNDELLLQFYAELYNNYKEENPFEEGFEYKVLEVGCYYYTMGVRRVVSLKETNTKSFDMYYNSTIRKIANQEFYINKQACWNCEFKIMCKIEMKRN